MGRFFETLLARAIAADEPGEQKLADELSRADDTSDIPALTQEYLDTILQPSAPLLVRIARCLDLMVDHDGRLHAWQQLRTRYPEDALVAMLELRAVLAAAEADDENAGQSRVEPADEPYFEVRERYSELLEHYAEDPLATEELRALGQTITALEQRGYLPRVMVLRGAWRRPD